MSGQSSSSPVMHDACEDLGQNYLRADIIQSLALACIQLQTVYVHTRRYIYKCIGPFMQLECHIHCAMISYTLRSGAGSFVPVDALAHQLRRVRGERAGSAAPRGGGRLTKLVR